MYASYERDLLYVMRRGPVYASYDERTYCTSYDEGTWCMPVMMRGPGVCQLCWCMSVMMRGPTVCQL